MKWLGFTGGLIKFPKWAWRASKRAQRWRNREGVGVGDGRHRVSDVQGLRAVTFPERTESALCPLMWCCVFSRMSSTSWTELSCIHLNAIWRVLKPTSPSISHLVQIISWSSLSKQGDKKHRVRTPLKERLQSEPGCSPWFSVLCCKTGNSL